MHSEQWTQKGENRQDLNRIILPLRPAMPRPITNLLSIYWHSLVISYPRAARLWARISNHCVSVSVCLCVCHTPPDAGIVWKRLNVGSRKQHHVARDSSFLTPRVAGGWPSIPSEIGAQSDPPNFKHQNFDQYPIIAPPPWKLAKKFN